MVSHKKGVMENPAGVVDLSCCMSEGVVQLDGHFSVFDGNCAIGIPSCRHHWSYSAIRNGGIVRKFLAADRREYVVIVARADRFVEVLADFTKERVAHQDGSVEASRQDASR